MSWSLRVAYGILWTWQRPEQTALEKGLVQPVCPSSAKNMFSPVFHSLCLCMCVCAGAIVEVTRCCVIFFPPLLSNTQLVWEVIKEWHAVFVFDSEHVCGKAEVLSLNLTLFLPHLWQGYNYKSNHIWQCLWANSVWLISYSDSL